MMSTISNTFSDYNIDEEEEESSAEGANDTGDGDGDAYVVQVKPLPKIRLDLCPAPREEDEYRDQNRKSRRRSSGGGSGVKRRSSGTSTGSPIKPSPNKSAREHLVGQRGSSVSADLSSALNSSFTSTAVTDKAGNNERLDATKATVELLLRRQNEQPHLSTAGKNQETSQGIVLTSVDADGFPALTSVGDNTGEVVTNKRNEEAPKAPVFAPSPSPALAIHQGRSNAASHQTGSSATFSGSSHLAESNIAVSPSVANEKRNHNCEEDNGQPSPTNIADTAPASSPHRLLSNSKHSRRAKDRPSKDEVSSEFSERRSPASSTEGRQDDRRRQRRKGARIRDEDEDEERSKDDCSGQNDINEVEVDGKEGPSLIFDWLLMICGDVSSFVSEGIIGGENSPPKQTGNDQRHAQLSSSKSRGHDEDPPKTRRNSTKRGGKYDLDHFKW